MVLVVSIEEQSSAADQTGGEGAEPEQAAPPVEECPELAHTEEVGATEVALPTVQP